MQHGKKAPLSHHWNSLSKFAIFSRLMTSIFFFQRKLLIRNGNNFTILFYHYSQKKDIYGMEGRPTRYRSEFSEQAEKLCKLGATDKEVADFFHVSDRTINRWKQSHFEFCQSLKNGKILADANVADRLYQRAMGFEHDSEEIKVVSDGSGLGSSIERVPIKKIYPPDTTAAIFWLKNRQKDKWRDKQEMGITDKEGNDVSSLTDEELTNKIAKIENALAK